MEELVRSRASPGEQGQEHLGRLGAEEHRGQLEVRALPGQVLQEGAGQGAGERVIPKF